AEAVAISGERIVAVGGGEIVESWRGPSTRVIDVGGGCVIPGFNDAHGHIERKGLKQQTPPLAGARPVADGLALLSAAAARTPPGEWIVTMPIGEPPHYFDALNTLAEKRLPTRAELDAAAPDNPVYIPGLFGNWGHPPGYTALNSRALTHNGINAASCPRCAGVELVCDPVTREP